MHLLGVRVLYSINVCLSSDHFRVLLIVHPTIMNKSGLRLRPSLIDFSIWNCSDISQLIWTLIPRCILIVLLQLICGIIHIPYNFSIYRAKSCRGRWMPNVVLFEFFFLLYSLLYERYHLCICSFWKPPFHLLIWFQFPFGVFFYPGIWWKSNCSTLVLITLFCFFVLSGSFSSLLILFWCSMPPCKSPKTTSYIYFIFSCRYYWCIILMLFEAFSTSLIISVCCCLILAAVPLLDRFVFSFPLLWICQYCIISRLLVFALF